MDSSTEEDIDELDDAVDLFVEDTEMCLVCGKFGSTELWYRCEICGKWTHADCSGSNTAENYKCEFCFTE